MAIRTEIDEVRDILNKYPEAYAKILDDGEVNDNEKLYDELFEYFLEDMPYGTQKARDGDPVQWITDHLDYLGLLTNDSEFTDDDGNPISEDEQARADGEADKLRKEEDD